VYVFLGLFFVPKKKKRVEEIELYSELAAAGGRDRVVGSRWKKLSCKCIYIYIFVYKYIYKK